jgi:DNA repair exonuclease SbcCD ATPase subunit
MNAAIKKDVASLEETIKDFEYQKKSLTEKIKIMNDALIRNKENIEKEVQEFLEEINKLNEELRNINNSIRNLDPSYVQEIIKIVTDVTNKFQEQYKNSIRCKTDLERLEKECAFYKHTTICPSCKQNLDKEFVEKIIDEKTLDIEKYKTASLKISARLEKYKENQRIAQEKLDSYREDERFNNRLNDRIKEIERSIQRYKKLIDEKTSSFLVIDEQELVGFISDLRVINSKLNEFYNERNIQQILLKILKDDGGKAEAVKQYITQINELINKFLIDMDFFVQFYLDENFNEVIKSRYRDEFSYNSFSDGQKLRINLSILFAWRELAKRRNSISINLLIFDEVLSA